MEELIFAKVRPDAKIPTKREEDAGRDLYPCFDEDFIIIQPLKTKMITTGIATAFSPKYYAQIQERGSTGSKGIKYSCGVIDSGYRGEWCIGITNCSPAELIIYKENCKQLDILLDAYKNATFYPYDKAIAQFVMLEVPVFEERVMDYNELLKIKSERGTGRLGSSGK